MDTEAGSLNKLWYRCESCAKDQIDNPAWYQVRREIEAAVWDEVRAQVWSVVWDQAYWEAANGKT